MGVHGIDEARRVLVEKAADRPGRKVDVAGAAHEREAGL